MDEEQDSRVSGGGGNWRARSGGITCRESRKVDIDGYLAARSSKGSESPAEHGTTINANRLIVLLIILGFFPKWQLALAIILLFLFAIGWSVKMRHHRSSASLIVWRSSHR